MRRAFASVGASPNQSGSGDCTGFGFDQMPSKRTVSDSNEAGASRQSTRHARS